MPSQKNNSILKNLIFSILLIIITWVISYTVSFKVMAQEPDSIKTQTPESETKPGSFLDDHYDFLNEARDFSEQDAQIHPFVNDKNRCNTFHDVFQTSGADASYIVFRENSAALLTANCSNCHPRYPGDHPVLIKASFTVPKDLPLSEKREITCMTCHNPHFIRFSNRPWYPRSYITTMLDHVKRKKEFKTYFLRRNNSKKELCLSCHKGVRHQRGF